jgi:hypothetical protein
MKVIRMACEQIPVPRVEEEIIGRGSNRITIAEEQLTSYALIYRDIDKFTEYHFSYIILDNQ